MEDNLGSFI